MSDNPKNADSAKYTYGLSKLAADVKAAPQKAIVEGYANYLSNPKGASQKPAQFVSNDEGTKIVGKSRIVYGGFESHKKLTEATKTQNDEDAAPSWVDKNGKHNLNFKWAEKHYGEKSDDALKFAIKDCREAMAANPDNPKNGVYADTIHVCSQHLQNRSKASK